MSSVKYAPTSSYSPGLSMPYFDARKYRSALRTPVWMASTSMSREGREGEFRRTIWSMMQMRRASDLSSLTPQGQRHIVDWVSNTYRTKPKTSGCSGSWASATHFSTSPFCSRIFLYQHSFSRTACANAFNCSASGPGATSSRPGMMTGGGSPIRKNLVRGDRPACIFEAEDTDVACAEMPRVTDGQKPLQRFGLMSDQVAHAFIP
jgi:hypothetical protein